MTRTATDTKPVRRVLAGVGVALLVTVGVACGGDGETDTPTTTVPAAETTLPVKNMPLNNCVSVMSGERPKPGVTVPRCIPTPTGSQPRK